MCQVHDIHGVYIVNLISSCVSILASLCVILIYFKTPRRETISTLIFCLSIADLLSSFSVTLSQTFLLFKVYTFGMCVMFRCFIQFFFISAFIWTACIAYQLFKETQMMTKIVNPPTAIYHSVSWGIPAAFVIVLLAGQKIVPSEQSWCHLQDSYEISFWVVPMILAFLWNSVFYVLIIRKVFVVVETGSVAPEYGQGMKKEVIKKLSLLLLVFMLCWAPDMFNHASQYFFQYCPPSWSYIMQDLLAPLQGFLNSLVYGLSNNEFKETFYRLFKQFTALFKRKREESYFVERISLMSDHA